MQKTTAQLRIGMIYKNKHFITSPIVTGDLEFLLDRIPARRISTPISIGSTYPTKIKNTQIILHELFYKDYIYKYLCQNQTMSVE